jgi:hypothetical protein
MRKLIRPIALFAPILGVIMYIGFSGSPVNAADASSTDIEDEFNNEVFPRDLKYLFPPPVPIFSNPERKFNSKISEDEDFQKKHGITDQRDLTDNNTERVAYGAVDRAEELEQPVHYSHTLHAGKLQIECQYCHTYARRSIHAGIPASQICMNCHSSGKVAVEGRKGKAQDDIKYLWSKFNKQEEIPWVKVHDLPDFVYFPHKRHVKAGVICQECHGEVQDDMTVARRVGELTMGWCLNCHESHPSISENYCTEDELKENPVGSCASEELRRAEIKDCWNCHK